MLLHLEKFFMFIDKEPPDTNYELKKICHKQVSEKKRIILQIKLTVFLCASSFVYGTLKLCQDMQAVDMFCA